MFARITFQILSAIASWSGTKTAQLVLGSVLATFIGWAHFVLRRLAPEIAKEAAGVLAAGMEEAKPIILPAAAVIIQEMTGQPLDPAALFGHDWVNAPAEGAVAGFDKIAAGITGAIAPNELMTPETGQANLRRLFGMHLGTTIQSWALNTIPDLMSLGHFRTIAGFHSAIEHGLGFQRLGRLMWVAPIREGITKPLTRLYQRTYQFTIPTAAEAVKGWYQGVYGDEALIDLLLSAGYSHDRAQELRDVAQRHLTPMEAEEALNRGLIDDTGLDPVLRADLLGPDRADLVKTLVLGRRRQQELDAMAKTARTLYRAGDLDEGIYRQYFAAAGWRPDETDAALAADQLAVRLEKQLTLVQLGDLVKTGHLTVDDYRARLRRQHYDDADIDALLTLLVKTLSPAQVIDAFTRGQMDEPTATKKLEGFGYSADDAAALLSLHGKRLSEGQVLDALRQHKITPADAQADLEGLGYSADLANMLLSLVTKQLSAADLQALVLRGDLSETEAVQRLMQQGYPQADAQAIVNLRIRLLTIGQVGDAYVAARISRAQVLADLQQRGLSLAEAQQVAAGLDAKAAAAQAKAAAAAARTAAATAKAEQQSGGTPPIP